MPSSGVARTRLAQRDMTDTLLITALVVLLISAAGTLYFRKRKNRWAGLFQMLLVCNGAYLVYGAVAYFA